LEPEVEVGADWDNSGAPKGFEVEALRIPIRSECSMGEAIPSSKV
jgi:hypothetical protein